MQAISHKPRLKMVSGETAPYWTAAVGSMTTWGKSPGDAYDKMDAKLARQRRNQRIEEEFGTIHGGVRIRRVKSSSDRMLLFSFRNNDHAYLALPKLFEFSEMGKPHRWTFISVNERSREDPLGQTGYIGVALDVARTVSFNAMDKKICGFMNDEWRKMVEILTCP